MNVRLYSLGRFLCLSFALLLLCCVIADASEITQEEIDSYSQGVTDEGTEATVVEDQTDPESTESNSANVYTSENPLYVSLTTEASSGTDPVDLSDSDGTDTSDYGVSLLADAPISADDTTGLKAVLLTVLGDYEPILFEYTYGNTGTGREVFQDDVWLCSFWMLMLLTYCVFRLIGGWLTRKQ